MYLLGEKPDFEDADSNCHQPLAGKGEVCHYQTI